jgi:acyl-[acyl-carrier-protein]-phospholipid O-acyltransferase/long-chain-fatty-acid--[acyl-carrier-protein] ligase
MNHNQLELLRTRRFLPLFLTQSFGAFNDNLFKNAIIFLATFGVGIAQDIDPKLLVPVAGGLFILPFFLFSATAGQLAEIHDKAELIRGIKLLEVVLMVVAAIALIQQSVPLLLLLLFMMGTQSSFFGPLKFSILPDHLTEHELIGGNAWVEVGTFVAILLGTLIAKYVLNDSGPWLMGGLLILVAVVGYLASRAIPPTEPAAPDLDLRLNPLTETWKILVHAAARRDIFLTILAISWFWLVGATYLTIMPAYCKETLGGNEDLVAFFMLVFSVGVAVGSLACNRMLKGQVHATFVPLGALGITLFSLDLYFASRHGTAGRELIGVGVFLAEFRGWRITLDTLLMAASGGVYIVPLMALLQHRSEVAHRSRNIAASNVVSALFMAVAAALVAGAFQIGVTIPGVILALAIASGAVAIYITRLLPGALAKALLAWLLELFYRVEVKGLEHFYAAGDKVLIVANHQSFLDAALVAAYVPADLTFAVNTYVSKARVLKHFMSLARTIPIDPTNPLSMRTLIDAVRNEEKVVIFPEGRITVTGSLMKVYEGPGMIADKSGALVLPVRLDGAQYSPFSRLRGKVRIRWFPKIQVTFLPPQRFAIPDSLRGRQRRQFAGRQLQDVMNGLIFESSNYRSTLFQSLLDARGTHGSRHPVLEDVERQPMNYGTLITRAVVLGRALSSGTRPGEYVGLLLPNSAANAVSFFGLLAHGRVPAMLNFSTGVAHAVSACRTAKIKKVYSSRRFVELAKLDDMVEGMGAIGVQVRYLEDVGESIGTGAKLLGLLAARMGNLWYRFSARDRYADDPAVVLFTSGTEGAPKGVVLSHTNIQANRYQVSAMIDFGPTDIVFNALPMFHSFGLTAGTLLPLLSGIKVFLYPSPLHYRIVPELVYDTNATLMFGTDTFLAGYARFAHPYDFYSVRYAFAGAEKLKDETRRQWSEGFGVRVFEGYGTTETAPILSMNSPMQNRRGSVGKLVPAVEYRLDPVAGIEGGGRLWVRGPNIMRGYLLASDPGWLQPPEGGWYDTGDIVEIDGDGFVFIKGRAKRFAKIGGEMVSLAAVEGLAADLWPDHRHAVVTQTDPKKGEKLVLLTDHPNADRDALGTHARDQGVGTLAVPAVVLNVKQVPLLGTGKTDYVGAKKLVDELVGKIRGQYT